MCVWGVTGPTRPFEVTDVLERGWSWFKFPEAGLKVRERAPKVDGKGNLTWCRVLQLVSCETNHRHIPVSMRPHASPPLVFRHHPVSSLDFNSLSFLHLFGKQVNVDKSGRISDNVKNMFNLDI